jgi:hypothetical protein
VSIESFKATQLNDQLQGISDALWAIRDELKKQDVALHLSNMVLELQRVVRTLQDYTSK